MSKPTRWEETAVGTNCRRLRPGPALHNQEPLLIRVYRPPAPVVGTLHLGGPQASRESFHPATPTAAREVFEVAQREAVQLANGKDGGWEGYCVVIWRDRRRGLVGIKDREGEIAREMGSVSRLQLSTGVPARGPGWVTIFAYGQKSECWIAHEGPETALADWLRHTLPEIHPHVEEMEPASDV